MSYLFAPAVVLTFSSPFRINVVGGMSSILCCFGLVACVSAQTPLVDPALRTAWQDFLLRPEVFGDYSEAEFDVAMAVAARILIDNEQIGPTTAAPAKKLRCRGLWAGANLEYQACLCSTANKLREDYARRSLDLSRRLRTAIGAAGPFGGWEPSIDDQLAWQRALLTLEVIERELASIAPAQPAAAAIVARRAVIAEFDPSNSDENSPNGKLFRIVGDAFATCRRVASKAVSATVQGSLTIGAAYGTPPFALATVDPDPALIAPTGDKLRVITQLIDLTAAQADQLGIIGLYDALRKLEVRVDRTWSVNKEKGNIAERGDAELPRPDPHTLLIRGESFTENDLREWSGLKRLSDEARQALDEVRKFAATKAPSIGKQDLPDVVPEVPQAADGKFAKNGPNGFQIYRSRLEVLLLDESVALREWKELKDDLQKRLGDANRDILPVDEKTQQCLISVAWEIVTDKWLKFGRSNLGPWGDKPFREQIGDDARFKSEPGGGENEVVKLAKRQSKAKAIDLVNEWLRDWIAEEVQKVWPSIPEEIGRRSSNQVSQEIPTETKPKEPPR